MSWLEDIFRFKSILPDFWEKYESGFENKPDSKDDIQTLGFTVIDTETTGLEIGKDHLISIAGIKVQNNRILVDKSLELTVKQDHWAGNESIAIHEILPSELNSGYFELEAIEKFLAFVKTDIIVAHHAAFDVGMINKVLNVQIGKKLLNKSIDTYDLAKRLDSGKLEHSDLSSKEYGLDKLCERYNIDVFERHTAAGDAFATGILLLKLLNRLRKRGIKTRSDLDL